MNIGAGLIPSLAFFAWVERNASLPWIGIEWGWPWISLQDQPTALLALWDFALFLVFGFLHSLFAQPFIHRRLERVLPPQAMRTAYIALTGISLLILMGLWQNTGWVLWSFPLRVKLSYAISVGVFWGFMLACGWIMSRFDPLQFVGLRQIYMTDEELTRTSGTPTLITDGIYSRVRHPIYTFTLLAFIVTPFMTLDRMLVILASFAYLAFAIPVEERKLIAIFGPAYEHYRHRVPAIIPRWSAG